VGGGEEGCIQPLNFKMNEIIEGTGKENMIVMKNQRGGRGERRMKSRTRL
jgi:hypothetical protein